MFRLILDRVAVLDFQMRPALCDELFLGHCIWIGKSAICLIIYIFSGDIMGLLKKEKSDRQRDVEVLKDRVDNERKEMQILIDKDRDDTNKKLKEEHDQRRIEQMELVQRLDNNEKCGKTDITVSSQIIFGY